MPFFLQDLLGHCNKLSDLRNDCLTKSVASRTIVCDLLDWRKVLEYSDRSMRTVPYFLQDLLRHCYKLSDLRNDCTNKSVARRFYLCSLSYSRLFLELRYW